MISAVLDTNVLINAVFDQTYDRAVLQQALAGTYRAVSSPRLMNEYEWVLEGNTFHLMPQIAKQMRHAMEQTLTIVRPPRATVPNVSRDPDDNHVIAAALESGAKVIVTNDHDLLDLGEYQGIRMIRPIAFLRMINAPIPRVSPELRTGVHQNSHDRSPTVRRPAEPMGPSVG